MATFMEFKSRGGNKVLLNVDHISDVEMAGVNSTEI